MGQAKLRGSKQERIEKAKNKGVFLFEINKENPEFNIAFEDGLRNSKKIGFKFEFIFVIVEQNTHLGNLYLTTDLKNMETQNSTFFIVCNPIYQKKIQKLDNKIKEIVTEIIRKKVFE